MLALVLREPHAETVREQLDRWKAEGTELHSPLLARYEIASALTRSRVHGELSHEDTDEALEIIDALGVAFDVTVDSARVIDVAVGMKRHSAYDAAYLALAERLDAKVWTLDGPLSRNAGARHLVSLIG
jgi:predicted nucleic acid-binding protein